MPTDSPFATLTRARDAVIPARWRQRLMTPRGLLVGFLVVHLGFLVFALIVSAQGNAFSDTNIYRAWTVAGFDDANLPSGPSPWVYPALAQLPMAFAGILGPGPFFFLWVLLISALNALAMGKLTDWGRNRAALPAGWWWLGFILLMGWLGFARVDGFTAPLVLIGLVYGVSHPFVASLILSAATWVKVWPAAVVLALLSAARRRGAVLLAGVLATLGAVGVAAASGSVHRIADFLTQQGDRGMQLEATFTTPWLWLSVLGIGDSHMYMNTDINSMQVDGPGSDVMSKLMQPLFVVAAVVVVALIVRGLRRGVRAGSLDRTALFLAGSLTMVTAFIVFNKVGSPQFMVWLGPVIAVGLVHDWRAWRTPALLAVLIGLATFLIYPLFYTALSHDNPVMALVLTVRNALLVVLMWWSARGLHRLGSAPKEAQVAAPRA
ncbi:glycosyltransferase family 87 protein [Kocuria sp.]|uniref:glycosyltransferase family 87 protein n=1 Tax=Kocuria sp. TaxID=1871328 RepID=UPI0026DB7B94|nr:glycosyltransferase family 87 protein [Kocuria sp.]MDO4917964.1 glycosyltransferase family 87 protein [Kocuria sp.]